MTDLERDLADCASYTKGPQIVMQWPACLDSKRAIILLRVKHGHGESSYYDFNGKETCFSRDALDAVQIEINKQCLKLRPIVDAMYTEQ